MPKSVTESTWSDAVSALSLSKIGRSDKLCMRGEKQRFTEVALRIENQWHSNHSMAACHYMFRVSAISHQIRLAAQLVDHHIENQNLAVGSNLKHMSLMEQESK